jgi:hypothetical protein
MKSYFTKRYLFFVHPVNKLNLGYPVLLLAADSNSKIDFWHSKGSDFEVALLS